MRADCATTLQCVVAKLAPPSWSVPGVAFNTPRLLNHGVYSNTFTAVFVNHTVTDCRATASVARQAKRLPYKSIQNAIYCAHSSNAAGLPRRCARTSPAKCSEPVIRIGFGFARASISASPIVEVMEWGSDGVMSEKISVNSPGASVRTAKELNGLVDKNAPWKTAKEGKAQSAIELLYDAAEALRIIAILISPVLPQSGASNF